MKKRLLFVVNTTEFFLSHRLPIARAAQREGYEVHVATGTVEQFSTLDQHGLIHHFVPLTRSGKNLLRELHSTWKLAKVLRKVRPDIVHLVTIKPVLYGGIAARLTGMPAVVAAISGLGSVFSAQDALARLIRAMVTWLYRLALDHANLRVIFQNEDDRAKLIAVCGLDRDRAVLIPGAGVSLEEYVFRPEPVGVPVVTFAARLLKDKGVCEFVEAARLLQRRGVKARFQIAGNPDPGNPATVCEQVLAQWCDEGVVTLLGHRHDIADLFSQSNIICLPSFYGEGLPKVLIEAAACGRAVITTDHPGCRDAIIAGKSGLLVPVRDTEALANELERLTREPELRQAMGRAGRQLAEESFSIDKVVAAHMDIYRELQHDKGKT